MEENNFANATYKDGFAGDRRYLKGFLAKMNLIFMIHPDRFNNDETKVIYVISRLYGNAMNWAASLMENQDPCLLNYEAFVERMKSVYGSYDSTFIANQKLRTIRQKRLGDIRSYILEFNSYADESSWNEEAKMDAFLVGLNDQIATRILEMFPGPRSLTAMQTIASRIDGRLSAHRQFTNNQNRSNNNLNNNNSNKKRWNFYKKGSNSKHYGPLSDEEKERRKRENLCLYCGSSNHTLGNCPLKNKKKSPSSTSHITNPEPKAKERTRISDQQNLSLPIFEFTLNVLKSSVKTKILLDSGSQLNLMDVYFANENNIPYSSETIHPEVGGIGGTQKILGETLPISIRYKNHNCKTKFYVVDLPSYCALLGAEWLSTHNPTIDFSSKTLHFNSKYCINNCLVIPNTYTTFIPSCNLINEIPKNSDNSDSQKIEEINNSEEKISNEIINNTKNQHKEPNEDNKNVIYLLPTKLSSFMDVFSEVAANMLPPHRQYDCEINLKPNTNLYYGPIYPLTEKELVAFKKYIDEMLAKGFIRKSNSFAGAPIFFVLKKNGELRLVVDYRRLNECTYRNSFPIPLINFMLERLRKGKIFSKIDLRQAFNLIRIKKGDEYKTAFTCVFGHFEYLVMPFGLKNAPAVFQHFINDVFEDIIGKFVFCYIDDIIIFSPDLETHYEHLTEVLTRLRKAGLYAKLEKCEFCVPFLDFLGHRISANGIYMDHKKVSSILEWPAPTNTKELQSFLGLANYYRRFITGFAKLSHPLNILLRKNTKFIWTTESHKAFDEIKSKFSSAPVLAYPNREIPFMVETDSSNFAIGAILSQTSTKDNKIHPVAFFSRALNHAERNYPIYDKELLAIVSALEHWRHLLKGTDIPFSIFSDHRNLLYQKKPEKMSQRLVRWSIFLSEFNFKIVYRSGSSNGKPDALSRRPDYIPSSDDSSSETPFFVLRPENFVVTVLTNSDLSNKILNECKDDIFYHNICEYLENKKLPIPHPNIDKFSLSNSFLLFDNKLYVPPKCRPFVLNVCHDSPSSGHFGIKKTLNLLNRYFWWPSSNPDTKDYVRSCEIYCRSKVSKHNLTAC